MIRLCCGIRLYAADYTRQLKLCTKLHNTDPHIRDLWHAKSIYFWSTDTLRIKWPFPLQTGRRGFPLAVQYLKSIRIDHVTLWWAADNRCARARESVCPWSCSKPYKHSKRPNGLWVQGSLVCNFLLWWRSRNKSACGKGQITSPESTTKT